MKEKFYIVTIYLQYLRGNGKWGKTSLNIILKANTKMEAIKKAHFEYYNNKKEEEEEYIIKTDVQQVIKKEDIKYQQFYLICNNAKSKIGEWS